MPTKSEVVVTPYDRQPTHTAEYECVACGGPEHSGTSRSGCPHCGAQDEIVPRGTCLRRKRRAWLVANGFPSDTPIPELKHTVPELDRSHPLDEDRARLADIEAQIRALREQRGPLRLRLMIDCVHAGSVIESWATKPMGGTSHNKLCLGCGLDLLSQDKEVVLGRRYGTPLLDVLATTVDEQVLYAARNAFPQTL